MIINDEIFIKELIEKAKAAQKIYEQFGQEQVDAIVKVVGKTIYDNAEILAIEAVEETGMGNVSSKIKKQQGVAVSHWSYVKDKKSVGVINEDPISQVTTYAKPLGVVACVTPSTNPTSTVCGNGMYILKSRNAMIVAPHPGAKKVTLHGVSLINKALKEIGAPENLIQIIEEPSIERTQILMQMADVTVATGGPGMVKAAYSSGRPSYGVGQGNVQSIMDRGCQDKYDTFAEDTIRCRSTDNGVQCTAEQCISIPIEETETILNKFKEYGALVIEDDSDLDKIREALFIKDGNNYRINTKLVGKTPFELGKLLNIPVSKDTKVLMVKAQGTADIDVLCKEKLCPIISYLPYNTFEEGVENAYLNLMVEGAGHSACLFSNDKEHINYTANKLPVARLSINTANTVAGGNSFSIGYNPTISLGCGSWGNNSISENLTYEHLMNITKVATIIEKAVDPTPNEIWA